MIWLAFLIGGLESSLSEKSSFSMLKAEKRFGGINGFEIFPNCRLKAYKYSYGLQNFSLSVYVTKYLFLLFLW